MLAVLLCAGPPGIAAAQSEKKVRILLLVDASAPLQVDYRTQGRRARSTIAAATLGLAPILIESKVASAERARESARLRAAVGEFDRRPAIEAAMAAVFRASSPYFDASIPADATVYGRPKEIDFNRARSDGFFYVLVVREEFAGMITAWALSTLSATSRLRFELYDTVARKRLAAGEVHGFAAAKHGVEPATTDRSIFLTEYPAALGAACARVYGELNKQDHLHTMAAAQGLGKEVPALGALLERYARLFHYEFRLPKGWHEVKGASKYSRTLEPKSADRMKFGVGFSIDLLIEEFGQNVMELDEYVGIFLARLKNLGYAVDTAEAFEGLALKEPHSSLILDRPNGTGKEVLLLRRIDNRFVAVYSIVFLEDFEGFWKKYARDLESLINDAQVTTRR